MGLPLLIVSERRQRWQRWRPSGTGALLALLADFAFLGALSPVPQGRAPLEAMHRSNSKLDPEISVREQSGFLAPLGHLVPVHVIWPSTILG